jgi:hypothetical protein
MEATDPKAQEKAQSMSMVVTSDSWVAPSVPGYSEVHDFYVKMAKELDWLPGAMGNMAGGGMAMNPQMGPAMEEFRKNAAKLQGMPLLQTMSMGMGAQGEQMQAPPPQQQDSSQNQDSKPTSAKEALTKGLGGMFGHKKKDQDNSNNSNSSGNSSGQQSGNSGSLMDMQTEVTSYSSSSIDKSLFDIPAGFTQVQRDPDDMFGGRKK